MAWTTCEHCGVKLNGYSKQNRHMRENHPHEKEVAEISQQLHYAEDRLFDYETKKRKHGILTAFLAEHPNMPEEVRNVLERARDSTLVRYWAMDGKLTQDFDIVIDIEKGRIAQYQAKLAELTKVEVTA